MPSIQHKRGTLSQIDSAAASNQLKVGEVYLATDEERLTVATAVNAHSPAAKQSEVEALNSIVARVLSGAVSDDGIANITTPWKGGTAFVSCYANSNYETGNGKINNHSGVLSFDTGASPQLGLYNAGASFAALNSTVTGTTGADGVTTVGREAGKLVIENRRGSTSYYSVTFLP